MKTTISLLTVFFAFLIVCQAQEEEEAIVFDDTPKARKTFTDDKSTQGVYLGLSALYGQINDEDAIFFGMEIGYLVNHSFAIGLAGVGFLSDQNLDIPINDDNDFLLAGGYGGLLVEPILMGHQKVHLSFPVLLGVGAAGFSEYDDRDPFGDYREDEWDVLLVAEPGVNVGFHISRVFQLDLSAKYRITNEVDLNLYDGNDLNGFSGGIALKFGLFDLGRKKR